MEESKSGLIIVAIVAVVAVASLVMTNISTLSTGLDATGNAKAASTFDKCVAYCKSHGALPPYCTSYYWLGDGSISYICNWDR